MNKLILLLALFTSLITTYAQNDQGWNDDFFKDDISSEVENEDDKGAGSVLFLVNPAKVEFVSSYTPEMLVNVVDEYRTRALDGEFLSLGINTGFIDMDVKKDTAKLTFYNSSLGELTKALKVKVSPKGEGKLKIQARIPYCHIKELYKNSTTENGRWKFSKRKEDQLKELLAL